MVASLAVGGGLVASRTDSGSCPFGAAPPSAVELESFRARSMAPLAAGASAPERRALGFTLGVASPGDVAAWIAARGGGCSAELGGGALRCTGARDGNGALRDLYARFDPSSRLVALDLLREGTAGEEAARCFREREAELARGLGAPSASAGEPSAAYLGAAALRQASARHRFADFTAELSATNLAGDGVVVREQYRTIPRPSGG